MTNENLLHVKLEYSEALSSKRDALSSEIHLLRIARSIKRYKSLRQKELTIKNRLNKKIKETKSEFSKLEKILPKLRTLENFKKEQNEEKILEIKEKKYSDDLESELQDIQARLRELSQ